MNLLFWGLTLAVIGKMMLAYGVILVHVKMAKERRIDAAVIHSFHTEMIISIIGILLIVAGYFLEVAFLGGFQFLIQCTGESCAASLGALLNAQ